jgi:hypothetical protein
VPGMDDLEQFAEQHDDKVDEGLQKAGDAAGAKFGHENEIDKGVEWAQEHTGSGDTDNPQSSDSADPSS